MKSIGLAVAGALAALAFATPPSAFAADKPTSYSKEQIAQGMKEAPALAQAAGMACTLSNAAFVGPSTGKDDKGKDVKQTVYEVSCKEGLGYAIVAPVGQTPKAYDCISLIGNAGLSCKLPENANPKTGLQPAVTQTGSQCKVADARYLGSKPTGETFYEVGCGAEPGFILQTAKGQAPKAIGCDQVSGALSCKFTTQEQLDAAATAKATALMAKSGKTCQITKSRTIGQLQSGDFAYEVACQDGSGYVVEATSAGAYKVAINCANTGGACKLTDASKAESSESGTYTKLAKAGGYQCDVAKYRFIGMDAKTNSEVVELQCSNTPQGAVAMFPSDNKGPAKFYDCVQAAALNQSCKLSDASAVYGKYTKALVSKGKKSCTVSNAHWLGATADGHDFIETACSDGLPGWVISMDHAGAVNELLTCGQAKAAGVACALPGNKK